MGGEIFEYVLSSIDMVLSTSVYSVCVWYTMAELQGLETRVFRKRNMVRKGLLPTNPQPLVGPAQQSMGAPKAPFADMQRVE